MEMSRGKKVALFIFEIFILKFTFRRCSQEIKGIQTNYANARRS